ncbi:MAG: YezD family protein [Candidatus Omnitrophica bacterium]|nr:YezD family protein [Candidatus Omnitrophota bacterium]
MIAKPSSTPVSPALLEQIREAIEGVKYGHVQVTIHNARVVQIEKVDKVRTDTSAHLTAGGASEQPCRDDRTSGSPRLELGR